MSSIHPALLIGGMVVNFLAVRAAGLFLPDGLYFSFSAFLFDTRDLNKALSLLPKLLVPFGVAFAIAALMDRIPFLQSRTHSTADDHVQFLDEQVPITLCFAAALTALLMAWPYILLWDILIDPSLQPYRLTYLVAYLAYVTAVAFFALAGANTALVWMRQRRSYTPAVPFSWSTLRNGVLSKPVMDILSGAVSAAIATFLATQGAALTP